MMFFFSNLETMVIRIHCGNLPYFDGDSTWTQQYLEKNMFYEVLLFLYLEV